MSKRSKSYEAPLTLDMEFGEALERFGGVDPNEFEKQRLDSEINSKRHIMSELIWSKELSTTDAQQPTSGGLVPYLRLTKSSLKTEDFQSWFRDTFFANANWAADTFGKEQGLESAKITMAVTVNGLKMGNKAFTITHGPNRHLKNNTPNTWLHWPSDVQELFWENDFSGCPISLTRMANGNFTLEIQAAKT